MPFQVQTVLSVQSPPAGVAVLLEVISLRQWRVCFLQGVWLRKNKNCEGQATQSPNSILGQMTLTSQRELRSGCHGWRR